jgi:hypothetical protein
LDDLVQQVAQNAPAASAGGLLGGGGIIAAMKIFRVFASTQDVELVKMDGQKQIAELKAEIAEKYLAKEALAPLFEELRHIRERVDQLIDRK